MFNTNNEFSKLWYSNNFAQIWIQLNSFNFNYYNLYRRGFECGQTDGELYFVLHFVSNMWQNVNTYILYSLDYGISFNLFHPLAKGEQPLLSNFSAKAGDEEIFDLKNNDSVYYVIGEMPLNVQSYNYSIGDINSYEWDFNNDGNIDSYEENPVYTYTDTGWYFINLTVYDGLDTNSFLRENYIYVYDSVGTYISEQTEPEMVKCFPNPFNKHITIQLPENINKNNLTVKIYSSSGEIIKTFYHVSNTLIWKGKDNKGNSVKPGVYYCLINTGKPIIKKLVLID